MGQSESASQAAKTGLLRTSCGLESDWA